jgi:CHAT domain-containing protein
MTRVVLVPMVVCVLVSALARVPGRADDPPPIRTPEEREKLEEKWGELYDQGSKSFEAGKFAEATKTFEAAHELTRRLYPKARFPNGHPAIALGRTQLAMCYATLGKPEKAIACAEEALTVWKQVFKGDHSVTATTMLVLAGFYRDNGKLLEAEALVNETRNMARRLKKDSLLQACTNELALLYQTQGKLAEAEPLARDALATARRLFKGDGLEVAASLRDLAFLCVAQGKLAEAEALAREALDMARRLFKGDSPLVASTLSVLADATFRQGKLADAEPLLKEALAIHKRLAGGNSRGVATNLAYLSLLYKQQGKLADAEALAREARAAYTQMHPGDHPDVATSTSNLAILYQAQRKWADAEPLHVSALEMSRRLVVTYARQRSEGEALNLVAPLPGFRDALLSTARQRALAGASEAATVYPAVWTAKGTVARVYEQRQYQARAASADPALVPMLADLTAARRHRAELLLAPATKDPETLDRRSADLKALDDTIAKRTESLTKGLPILARAERLNAAPLSELQKALPEDTAVVDFAHYLFGEYDNEKPVGEKATATWRYLAFVVTRGQVAWVDLDTAARIEPVIGAWREGITSGKEIPAALPAKARELVWEKVRKQLPATVRTVYVCPDAALYRLPFGALPGDKPGTILLEDFALATIPHVPFLLDKLWPQDGPAGAPAKTLVVGGVKYDAEAVPPAPGAPAARRGEPLVKPDAKLSWAALPATAGEANGVAEAAARKKLAVTRLAGDAATPAAVLTALPGTGYAHLATHGFFSDASFRGLFQLDDKDYATSARGERIGRAINNPLVMTGLVFAGANNPKAPGRGILTGEQLIDLDLSGLDLAVLSACETGLGDVAGGEGTFGLQRAFHYAGTRNVVASLWKVPDQSTAALMGLFYRNLWERNLSPMESLRQAQLEIYKNPDRIPNLAKGFRGKFETVDGSGEVVVKPTADGKTPPLFWAAFVLSGPGR